MYTQKIAIIFDESRAVVALDHGRLGLENKFFPNKITQSPAYTTFIYKLCKINWTAPKFKFML